MAAITLIMERGFPPWDSVRDIARATDPGSWLLVGGLMTQVHAGLAGYSSRATKDIDMLVDLLASSAHAARVEKTLESMGYAPREPGLRGSAFHRMVKDGCVVDILVADHLPSGKRASAKINRWPLMEIPGGAQAIDRRMKVRIVLEGEAFSIEIPDLLGALVLKSAAYAADRRDMHRHLEDVALLAGLTTDLKSMRERLRGSDGKRLRAAWEALADPNEPAWLLLPDDVRTRGMDALRILTA